MKNSIFKLFNVILVIGVLAVGCDLTESTVDEPSDVQVQMKVNAGPVAKAMLTSNNEHTNTLEIQEVKMFIEKMELESITDDSSDFEIENFIADLPLDGSPLVITEKQIPAGLYDEFELEMEKPDDDDVQVKDPDFRDETGSYSLVVKGLFNGEEFTFRSAEDFEIEMDLNPPLEVTETESSTLVISIDVDSWFTGSNGEKLDPKDFKNTEMINDNIENSFDGFEDDYDDDSEEYEFEGYVESVDLTEQTFTLTNGMTLHVNSETRFDDDLKSLDELEYAISEGYTVEADGEYYVDSSGRNVVVEVDLEIEDEDDFEDYDFEGYVESVDLTEQTFTLTNGMTLHVNSETRFDDDLKSLDELEHAISEGYTVEADGEYYVDSSGRDVVVEVDLEIEDEDDFEDYDFEGYVESVDLTEQTFTLTNGMTLHVNSETRFEDDLKSLDELEHAISEGYTVEADGEYYVDSSGRDVVIEVDLEIENGDDD
ncbi:DUF5666 domain-containing protein [Rhodohalobacter barkolensis]|uniref:DUF5666 domain-containing protein n=1 Tax=Rhodohalobacter barkolensis TaxID=2053187 RepID=A0A2N0VIG8_9BACT|nr:DUF5666 domain-containing protein [Rhodohalobacter barkolensis]PKD43990.1 hypothetical protein CWD77_00495 [Rhodohalobacter barkolensis]